MIVNVIAQFGMFLVRRYAAEMLFDAVILAGEKASKLTETQVDDEWVDKFKSDKSTILEFFK